jgi:hypothetical protein
MDEPAFGPFPLFRRSNSIPKIASARRRDPARYFAFCARRAAPAGSGNAAGMQIRLLENVAIRQEQNLPVEGLLAVLSRS